MLKFRILFILLLLTLGFSAVKAQNTGINAPKRQFDEPRRPRLLQELGLTQEQIRRIRQINIENRNKIRGANFRLREANRNLDAAIYSDVADQTLIETRLREFQDAQAEVARIRALTELEIRKVLTPEQLVKFRELRQKFQQMRENRRDDFDVPASNPPNRNSDVKKKPGFLE